MARVDNQHEILSWNYDIISPRTSPRTTESKIILVNLTILSFSLIPRLPLIIRRNYTINLSLNHFHISFILVVADSCLFGSCNLHFVKLNFVFNQMALGIRNNILWHPQQFKHFLSVSSQLKCWVHCGCLHSLRKHYFKFVRKS